MPSDINNTKSSGTIRVRYAPSPTGDPHVGNIRTAIFTWLYAKNKSGKFIVRIEDTDQNRTIPGALENILNSLNWLSIDWDEGPSNDKPFGPYIQSKRLEKYYIPFAEQLVEKGHAYKCYCSQERLSEVRETRRVQKLETSYDRRCRHLTTEQKYDFDKTQSSSVIRFAMPLKGEWELSDIIRGEVKFQNKVIDDFIIIKSDGYPTYHLANVIDDHCMEISHVIRAEEWLSSTPKHLAIYKALGWNPPTFAHLPIILAPDKSKLSKRHGTTSVLDYRKQGYLPNAMFVFLSLLGWSLDDKTEVLTIPEIIANFSLERVSKSGAIFDIQKLNWLNGQYIRKVSDKSLAQMIISYWERYPESGISPIPTLSKIIPIVPLIKERIKTLNEIKPLVNFFFSDDIQYENKDLIQKGMDKTTTKSALQKIIGNLSNIEKFDELTIEGSLRMTAEEMELKPRQLLGSIRVALSGLEVSPPLFKSIEILGKTSSLQRIDKAISKLE